MHELDISGPTHPEADSDGEDSDNNDAYETAAEPHPKGRSHHFDVKPHAASLFTKVHYGAQDGEIQRLKHYLLTADHLQLYLRGFDISDEIARLLLAYCNSVAQPPLSLWYPNTNGKAVMQVGQLCPRESRPQVDEDACVFFESLDNYATNPGYTSAYAEKYFEQSTAIIEAGLSRLCIMKIPGAGDRCYLGSLEFADTKY
ncbi:hypothetical protein BO82DRAFT_360340 [Aspergillus uvarum CBS 121591]|uniref:Uncharacterized protein n=1 Tax=Aspergillus uvarum CBS 121591 TaxID=1448315 RepID=A0A319CXU8_9EURO|nr:hypothetical protein BO82DRAFT_360340 [Aspergillus uvarum CBS 121591]PYH87247.1 hypothetical protein BO82DRAFT_360340 [Aspergillus uvarum CBS 121591]